MAQIMHVYLRSQEVVIHLSLVYINYVYAHKDCKLSNASRLCENCEIKVICL